MRVGSSLAASLDGAKQRISSFRGFDGPGRRCRRRANQKVHQRDLFVYGQDPLAGSCEVGRNALGNRVGDVLGHALPALGSGAVDVLLQQRWKPELLTLIGWERLVETCSTRP